MYSLPFAHGVLNASALRETVVEITLYAESVRRNEAHTRTLRTAAATLTWPRCARLLAWMQPIREKMDLIDVCRGTRSPCRHDV